MDPFIFFLLLVLALAFLAEIWILTTPIELTVLLEHSALDTRFALGISFGPAGLMNCLKNGKWTRTLLFGKHTIHEFPPEESLLPIPEDKTEDKDESGEKFDPRIMNVIARHLPGLISDIRTLFITGIHAFSLQSLDLDFRLGLSSPAMTGKIFGFFSAFKGIFFQMDRVSLHMTPEFNREVLEGRGYLSLRINYPVRILAAFISVLTGKNVRGLVRDIWRGGYSND